MYLTRYTPAPPEKPEQFLSRNLNEVRQYAQVLANRYNKNIGIYMQVETQVDIATPQSKTGSIQSKKEEKLESANN